MTIQLNHTIVFSKDKQKAAAFLAEILGLPPPVSMPPFAVVTLDNGVSLDFAEPGVAFVVGHYAFLVDDAVFDAALARIKAKGLTYWPAPWPGNENTINENDGGRGFYFRDPDGHGLELITVPYGGWPQKTPKS